MIYDCVTFFNEVDILLLRMEVLDSSVDYFVIVEAGKTHSGQDKNFIFEENAEKFDRFSHKIIYHKVFDFPEFKNSWTYENFQRNQIREALTGCSEEDIILLSDVDEIPSPEKIPKTIKAGEVACFLQDMRHYYFNCYKPTEIVWDGGTKALTYETIAENLLDERFVTYNDHSFPKYLNKGVTMTKVRLYRKLNFIVDGGFHLSYQGGASYIAEKIKAYSHQENNDHLRSDRDFIEAQLSQGKDPIHKQCELRFLDPKDMDFYGKVSDKYFYVSGKYTHKAKYDFQKLLSSIVFLLKGFARKILLR